MPQVHQRYGCTSKKRRAVEESPNSSNTATPVTLGAAFSPLQKHDSAGIPITGSPLSKPATLRTFPAYATSVPTDTNLDEISPSPDEVEARSDDVTYSSTRPPSATAETLFSAAPNTTLASDVTASPTCPRSTSSATFSPATSTRVHDEFTTCCETIKTRKRVHFSDGLHEYIAAQEKSSPSSADEERKTLLKELPFYNQTITPLLPCRKINSLPRSCDFAVDWTSLRPTLIDGGSAVSLVPSHLLTTFNPKIKIPLASFDNRTSSGIGVTNLLIDLGITEVKPHLFVVIESMNEFLTLGLDFLRRFDLCHVYSRQILMSFSTSKSIALIHFDNNQFDEDIFWTHFLRPSSTDAFPSRSVTISRSHENVPVDTIEFRVSQLLDEVPDITRPPDFNGEYNIPHMLTIELKPTFRHKYLRPRPCSTVYKKFIKDKFDDLVRQGVLIKSSSSTSSPITVVRKKDGSPRICIDYSYLNSHTIQLNYPLPRVTDLYHIITSKHKWFSTLDLKDAYFSLKMDPATAHLAGISAPHGNFIPLRTPFGLTNAPMKFCEMVAALIDGLEGSVFAYLDDFLVFSETLDDHLQHLRALLTRLSRWRLFLNLPKSHFAKQMVCFVGHEISTKGITPLADKVEALKNLRPPKTITEVRSFLGSMGYYRAHLPKLAEIVAPINALLSGEKRPKKSPVPWGEKEQLAFDSAIACLSEAATLAFEDPDLPLIVTTDASDTHVGAVLEQYASAKDHVNTKPLAYFSKAIPKTDVPQSTFNRELRGVILALRYFKYRIFGRPLIVRTDHAAILGAIANGTGSHTPQETRWIYQIKEFNPTVIFLSGISNSMADYLSRPTGNKDKIKQSVDTSTTTGEKKEPIQNFAVNFITRSMSKQTARSMMTSQIDTCPALRTLSPNILACAQSKDSSFLRLVKSKVSTLRPQLTLTSIKVGAPHNCTLVGVCTLDAPHDFRPLVPPALQPVVFHIIHNAIHMGKKKTVDAITGQFFWPGMNLNIMNWVKYCPKCQSCKISRHNRARLCNFPSCSTRFHTIHMDLVGPLPRSFGFSYILTTRERVTGFTVAVPLRRKTTNCVIRAFLQQYVGVLGIPSVIVTDNGGEFVSRAFDELCQTLGVVHRRTTPYHPQSNGHVERVHRTLKTALRALDKHSSWALHLPHIVLTINNLTVDKNDFTPYQMVFGQPGQLPGFCPVKQQEDTPYLSPSNLHIFQEVMTYHQKKNRPLPNNKPYVDPNLLTCKSVWIRNMHPEGPLSPLYVGPFTILHREEKHLTINHHNAGQTRVSVDRCKVAACASDVQNEDNDDDSNNIIHDSDSESSISSDSTSSADEDN